MKIDLPNRDFMALLGSPVSLSKSPLMHNTAFKKLGLDYEYITVEAVEENLEETVKYLVSNGIKGFNCTMPVKNKMFEICDEATPSASIMKAVNTVKIENGKIFGHNTDGIGFVKSVEETGTCIIDSVVTVLGTGGVAKAICTQTALDGAKEIRIFGRNGESFNNMGKLVTELNTRTSCKVLMYKYDNKKLNECIKSSDILVNATKVGMAEPSACVVSDFSEFHNKLLVYDVIYEPAMTMLLKRAKANGCKVKNGIDLLYYQGESAFRIWTGKDMPEGIKELVREAVND